MREIESSTGAFSRRNDIFAMYSRRSSLRNAVAFVSAQKVPRCQWMVSTLVEGLLGGLKRRSTPFAVCFVGSVLQNTK